MKKDTTTIEKSKLERLLAKAEIVDKLIEDGVIPKCVPPEKNATGEAADKPVEEFDMKEFVEEALKVLTKEELYFTVKLRLAKMHPEDPFVFSQREVEKFDELLKKMRSAIDELKNCYRVMDFIETLLIREHMLRNDAKINETELTKEEGTNEPNRKIADEGV